jgi:hypothetical protein
MDHTPVRQQPTVAMLHHDTATARVLQRPGRGDPRTSGLGWLPPICIRYTRVGRAQQQRFRLHPNRNILGLRIHPDRSPEVIPINDGLRQRFNPCANYRAASPILRASSRMKAAPCTVNFADAAVGIPTPSRPTSKRFLTSASASARTAPACMRATGSALAPAGNQRPNQPTKSESLRPASLEHCCRMHFCTPAIALEKNGVPTFCHRTSTTKGRGI